MENSQKPDKSLCMADLKSEALRYWQMGLAVVPMKLFWDENKKEWKKRPLCDWAKWQKTPQTLEEFEAFNWANIEAFAVLLGKTYEGYYLCCFDIDKPDFDLTLLRTTRFERTISGLLHAFYLSKRPVEGIKRHDLNLELLGMNNLVVVSPSKGYTALNDNPPTLVENATALFYELIAKIEGELKPEAEKQIQSEGVESEVLAKWLEQIKQKLDVAGEGAKYVSVHCPFHRPDKNPSFALHKQKFYAIDFHTGETFSLKQLAEKLNIKLEGVREAEGEASFSIEFLDKISQKPSLIKCIKEDLGKRVKRDEVAKSTVFFTGLSAFLKEPNNLCLKGESSIGKTYITTETLAYFPEKDVWFIGGMSQKSLIHDYGVVLGPDGEPLPERPEKPLKNAFKDDLGFNAEAFKEALNKYKSKLKEWSEKVRRAYTLIDLQHRILVFLEAPDEQTFRMLYPILSHDKEEIEYRFVDRTGKGQLKTMLVKIRGWPATIFCTTDRKYLEEFSTRTLTVTPEISKEKISEALKLTTLKASKPWEFKKETEESKLIKNLIKALKVQLISGNLDVCVPFPNLEELFPCEIARDMRDYPHFIQLLKSITALNSLKRATLKIEDNEYIVSTLEDIKTALEIYKEILETTRTGTEKRILDFYHKVVKTKASWLLSDLVKAYNEKAERKVSSETLRRWLERLSEIGYVNIEKSDLDKRLNTYEPLIKEEKSTIHHISEMWTVLEAKLKEGFENWIKEIHNTGRFFIKKIFSEDIHNKGIESAIQEKEISTEDFSKLVLGEVTLEKIFSNTEEGVLRISSEEDLKPNLEKKPETLHIGENRGIVDNSLLGSGASTKTVFHYRKIASQDKCELCGKNPTMFQIKGPEGLIFSRCLSCFDSLRAMLKNAEFREENSDGKFDYVR